MAVVFLAIHVLTSILDTFVHIGWLAIVVPFTSPYSRFWVGLGTIALDLMAGGLHLQPAAGAPEAGHLARHPLAGLRLLAHRPGPHLRHGHRLERALGHRAGRPVRALRRPCSAVANASSRQANGHAPDPELPLGSAHPIAYPRRHQRRPS